MEGKCLVLHFDINKTIIMSDIGAGRNLEGTLNSLLSECTWGLFDRSKPHEERTPLDWAVCSDVPSVFPPRDDAVTYGEFLEVHTTTIKKERVAVKTTYTNPGCTGERFRSYFDRLQTALVLDSDAPIPEEVADLFTSGCHHILPSFFQAIQYLVAESVNFRIVFRTFGVDVPSIAREFNLFCEGRHPHFPLDGPSLEHLKLNLSSGYGRLLRTAEGPEGVELVNATTEDSMAVGHRAVDDVLLRSWLRVDCSQLEEEGEEEGHQNTVAVRDDFSWWHTANNESCQAGKLFVVDRPPAAGGLVEVFLDDNIERDRAHIVDVRDRQTFEPVPFAQAGEYLRRVEPYCAITQRDYYQSMLREILDRHPGLRRKR